MFTPMHRLPFIFLACILTCVPSVIKAQDSNDDYDLDPDRELVGPPVLYSGYHWNSENDIDRGGSFSADSWVVRIPLFILGQDKDFFLTGSAKYEYSQFEFKNFDLLPRDIDVHAIRARLTGYWEPQASKWFAQLRLEPGLYTDGRDIDSDDYQSRVLGAVGYKWSPNLRFLVAGYYTESYGDGRLYPAAGVIWEPNDQWTFHIAPPEPRITYYPTKDWAIHLKGSSGGDSWNIDPDTSETIDQLIHRQFRVGVGIERRIYKDLWASLWGGANVFQKLKLQDQNDRVLFDEDVDPGYYIYAGFHLAAW